MNRQQPWMESLKIHKRLLRILYVEYSMWRCMAVLTDNWSLVNSLEYIWHVIYWGSTYLTLGAVVQIWTGILGDSTENLLHKFRHFAR